MAQKSPKEFFCFTIDDMRKVVYFVRHAEAGVNTDPLMKEGGDVLTERGLLEAQMIADRFLEIPFESLYTSKILRARLTAQEIGDRIGKMSVIEESFKERKVVYTSSSEYFFEEKYEDFLARVFEAKVFLEQLPDEKIVVVSHALFIRAFLACILLGEKLTEDILAHFGRTLVISHASLTKCEYDFEKKKWRIAFWNDVSHLSSI